MNAEEFGLLFGTTEMVCATALLHTGIARVDADALGAYLGSSGKSVRETGVREVLDRAVKATEAAAQEARNLDALAALLLLVDAQAQLLNVAGECIGLSLGRVRSDGARAAANKRHEPTRDAKALVLAWWAKNRAAMNKEEAADAIVAERQVGESRATIRKWLRGA